MTERKFTIQEVETQTHVPAATLRQWERRYDFPQPERSENGYRLYSHKDIQSIEAMKGYIENGMPSSRAAKLVQHHMLAVQPAHSDSLEGFYQQLTQAFLNLDEAKANEVLSKAHALHSSHDVLIKVIQKSIVELGERWHAGKLDISTEHFASNYIQARLRTLLSSQPENSKGKTILISCAPLDQHELGALILAAMLKQTAYRVVYLGANTPLQELRAVCERLKPSAVLVSVTTQRALEEVKREHKHLLKLAPIVALGGYALSKNYEMVFPQDIKLIRANAKTAVEQIQAYLAELDAVALKKY